MLRLISIIGIAIAMVIGFIAISTQMKDDYSARSRVVDVLKQMKKLADDELQCTAGNDSQNSQQPTPDETDNDTPVVEITSELEITPLISDQSTDEDSDNNKSKSNQSSENDAPRVETGDSNTATEKLQPSSETVNLEAADIERNKDIIQTMGYRLLNQETVEVKVIFNDVQGESGKTKIKAGGKIIIHCSCLSDAVFCQTAESNINKNYLPKILDKQ